MAWIKQIYQLFSQVTFYETSMTIIRIDNQKSKQCPPKTIERHDNNSEEGLKKWICLEKIEDEYQ